MKKAKLELFLISFSVDYLKQVLVPKTNQVVKHEMEFGELIRCVGYWF